MLDNVQKIIDQLKLGEDSFVEFKEVKFRGEDVVELNPESLAGEICAFANTAGGVMLAGVHDDGMVQGIPQEKLSVVENYISNVCRNNCRPPVLPLIKILRCRIQKERISRSLKLIFRKASLCTKRVVAVIFNASV